MSLAPLLCLSSILAHTREDDPPYWPMFAFAAALSLALYCMAVMIFVPYARFRTTLPFGLLFLALIFPPAFFYLTAYILLTK